MQQTVAVQEKDKIETTSGKAFDTDYLDKAHLDDVMDIASIGSGRRLVKTEFKEFTHEFATWVIQELQELGYDRKLNNDRIITYMKRMCGGTFLAEQAHVDICEFDGKQYRLNGQHVSFARIELAAFDPKFSAKYRPKIAVFHYKANSAEDMRLLYSNIDRQLVRGNNAVADSYLYQREEFCWPGETAPDGSPVPISKSIIKALAQGLQVWQFGVNSGRSIGIDDTCYLLLNKHYETAMRVATFLRQCNQQGCIHVKRSPVYGAMFGTYGVAKDASNEFWTAVRDGNDLSMNDPRLKLRHMLATHSVSWGVGTDSVKSKSVTGEEMYRWCQVAWNAFRQGNDLRLLKVPPQRLAFK